MPVAVKNGPSKHIQSIEASVVATESLHEGGSASVFFNVIKKAHTAFGKKPDMLEMRFA